MTRKKELQVFVSTLRDQVNLLEQGIEQLYEQHAAAHAERNTAKRQHDTDVLKVLEADADKRSLPPGTATADDATMVNDEEDHAQCTPQELQTLRQKALELDQIKAGLA